MKAFEAIIDAFFDTQANSQKLFFPYGKLNKGYVINSEAQYQELRNFTKKRYIAVAVAAAAIFILPFNFIWLIFCLCAVVVCDFAVVKKKLADS